MSVKYSINLPTELDVINDLLNDSWLDADNILHIKNESLLKVPVKLQVRDNAEIVKESWAGLLSTENVPEFNADLTIKNLERYNINDTVKIGYYDICEIEYDNEKNKISIVTGVPLTFDIFVKSFDITLEVEEVPYKWVERTLFLFGMINLDMTADI